MADPTRSQRRDQPSSSHHGEDEDESGSGTPLNNSHAANGYANGNGDIRSLGSPPPASASAASHSQATLSMVSSKEKTYHQRAPTPRWGIPALVMVWLLNGALIVAIVYALMNWTAFTWIVGSAAWATFLEIIVVMMMLYLTCAGCCLLGFETRIRDSYLQLRHHRQCRMLSVAAVPVFIIAVFTALALLALAPLSASNSYVQLHASEVFYAADIKHDGKLYFWEFSKYMYTLPAYSSYVNDTSFQTELLHIFSALDTSDLGYLTTEELYVGILSALTPARQRFGYAVASIGGIAVLFMCLYSCWYRRLEHDKIEMEPDDFLLPYASGGADRESDDDDEESESGSLMSSIRTDRALRHAAAHGRGNVEAIDEEDGDNDGNDNDAAPADDDHDEPAVDHDGEGDVAIEMDDVDDGNGAYDHQDDGQSSAYHDREVEDQE